MDKYYVTAKTEIEKLGSALTFEGLKEDDESLQEFIDWVKALTPLKRERIYIIKGRIMNKYYHLTGDNAYQDECNIVSIDLNDMEHFSAVIMPRFQIGARWLDDIIANNVRREKEKEN